MIDKAIIEGRLSEPFNADGVHTHCQEYSIEQCRSYLSKHVLNNSSGDLELFERVDRGKYKRLEFYIRRDAYIDILEPVFLPADVISKDIMKYFSALLRVLGMEAKGWDPYAESRAMLDDLNGFFKIDKPKKWFKKPLETHWRLGLLLYTHIVEMDAPYEVILNMLRFQLGAGYSPNPYFDYLSLKEQKQFKKRGISTIRKIEIIKTLSNKANLKVGEIFDDFYDNRIRNAISHSDYILTEDSFRCRGGISGDNGFEKTFDDLDKMLLSAKAFIAAFFCIEQTARSIWGEMANKAIPYDNHYKGMMEVLADKNELMCGFKVHWPNETDSTYRRTADGVEMTNCMPAIQQNTLELMVGLYASDPSTFSPLVEKNGRPVYTKREGNDEPLHWPGDGSVT
ncbi:MAG: hypothetical protein ABJJ43_06510 [Ekhidna sp.]